MSTLLASFRWAGVGASDQFMQDAEGTVGRLPDDYLAVLRLQDGGEGWVGGGAYLRLWPIEELEDRNRLLQAAHFVPGVVLIGTDGADDLYGISLGTGSYWILPAVGLSSDTGEEVARSWHEFLAALARR